MAVSERQSRAITSPFGSPPTPTILPILLSNHKHRHCRRRHSELRYWFRIMGTVEWFGGFADNVSTNIGTQNRDEVILICL